MKERITEPLSFHHIKLWFSLPHVDMRFYCIGRRSFAKERCLSPRHFLGKSIGRQGRQTLLGGSWNGLESSLHGQLQWRRNGCLCRNFAPTDDFTRPRWKIDVRCTRDHFAAKRSRPIRDGPLVGWGCVVCHAGRTSTIQMGSSVRQTILQHIQRWSKEPSRGPRYSHFAGGMRLASGIHVGRSSKAMEFVRCHATSLGSGKGIFQSSQHLSKRI